MTRGECFACHRPTVAVKGPENASKRIQPTSDFRIGYVVEAMDGRKLDTPRLVCRPCLGHHIPSSVAA